MYTLDIETAPYRSSFLKETDERQRVWTERYATKYPDLTPEQSYDSYAGLYPEFGRIVCVSIGVKYAGKYFVKSIAGTNEPAILSKTYDALKKCEDICGHNIREFDIPYLCKRFLIHKMEIPPVINTMGKKPWESKHIHDTMVMWQFGSRAYTSLDACCVVLRIPTPKDAISGKDVAEYFYEGKIEDIATYCGKDVYATEQLRAAMTGDEVFPAQFVYEYFNYETSPVKEN